MCWRYTAFLAGPPQQLGLSHCGLRRSAGQFANSAETTCSPLGKLPLLGSAEGLSGGLGVPKGEGKFSNWAQIQPGQAAGLVELPVGGKAKGRGHRQCRGNLWI